MHPFHRSHSARPHHAQLPQNYGIRRNRSSSDPTQTARQYLHEGRLSDAVRLLRNLPRHSNHTTNLIGEFVAYIERKADSGNIQNCISLLDKIHHDGLGFTNDLAYQFIDRYFTRSTDNQNLVERSDRILRACHGHKTLFNRYFLEHMVPHLNHLEFNHKQNFINAYFSRIGDVVENGRTAVTGQITNRPFEDYQRLLHIENLHRRDNVLLVGGGRSPIQAHLPEQRVTNYDRFHTHGMHIDDFSRRLTNPFRSNQVARSHIRGDFCSRDIRRLPPQNHIWCLYSLPLYAQSIDKTKQFFRNAVSVMQPGSKLHIFPIGHRSSLVRKLNQVYELTSNELADFDRQVVAGIRGESNFFSVREYSETISSRSQFSSRVIYLQDRGVIITLNRPTQEALPALERIMRDAQYVVTNPRRRSNRNHRDYV